MPALRFRRRGIGHSYALALIAISGWCHATEPVIAIDVGHSRSAPGAMSARGAWEFDFNAALAKTVHHALQSQGVRAFLIGDKGDMTSLTRRTALAGEQGATFFLSIHHDSAQPQYFQSWNWQGAERHYTDRFSGYSLFVSRKNADVDKSLRCAGMLGAELQKAGMHFSPHHAEPIQGESREWADQRHGVYYYDNLAVLRTATMPAMLLEAGVIVNRNEETLLQTPAMRETIAAAVVRGLADCGVIKVRLAPVPPPLPQPDQ